MKNFLYSAFLAFAPCIFSGCSSNSSPPEEMILRHDWAIRSSTDLSDDGSRISTTDYKPGGWYPTSVPTTVLAALVRNNVYPDPYYGTNIKSLPGYTEQRRGGMPDDSPYRVPWWFREVFKIPESYQGKHVWIHFPSINYRANIWVNGQQVADTTEIEGAYRRFDLDITDYAHPGETNCLALEIFPPQGMDLTITWVDWNPTPPDRGMGIWYDVTLDATGPVSIDNTHVITDLDLPAVDHANVTVAAQLTNITDDEVNGTLTGKFDGKTFSQQVSIDPHSSVTATFDPKQYPELHITSPRLWWPHTVGKPNLYDLEMTFSTRGEISDQKREHVGIREISSYMNNFNDSLHTRVFQINGKNIVIRGGGYVEDMMLQPSPARLQTDIDYAKQMNLNTLRLEAPRGPDELFKLCDENGIMVMVGWCCCSAWERWQNWTPHTADIAEASLKSQVIRLRNHPSVFDWLYGSDNFPPADVERRYIDVLDQCDGTRPYQSSATQDSSAIAGYTGLWMGPFPDVYAYFPPAYWYGKLEFNTEAGPSGEQIAPVESMRKMMPEQDLWPRSESWEIRLHQRFDPQARSALLARYGEPKSLDEYSMKSQMLQLEATRAMFEAYAGNKYKSSGIIYWMYNSAWPSLYWQLFDYYHNPNGAFYGARRACETLHIQYAYSDKGIYVVNGHYRDFKDLKVSAKVYDFDMKERLSDETTADLGPDESKKVLDLKWPTSLTAVYFLKLELRTASDSLLSTNFYWLSNKGDEKADFSGLGKLPDVELKVTPSPITNEGTMSSITVTLENAGTQLAFFVNPKIKKKISRAMVLPVFWEDNYFELLPGATKSVTVKWHNRDAGQDVLYLEVDGWNVKNVEHDLR